MAYDIRIDAPGAGEWIMGRIGAGTYAENISHSIARYRDGDIVGGFVVEAGFGQAVIVHMAGVDERWCCRDLLWMVFHYAFVQLRCTKVIGPVASDNHRSLETSLRCGFKLEAVVKDVFKPGVHLMVLTMGIADCPWLRVLPRSYMPGDIARKVANG